MTSDVVTERLIRAAPFSAEEENDGRQFRTNGARSKGVEKIKRARIDSALAFLKAFDNSCLAIQKTNRTYSVEINITSTNIYKT